MTSQIDTLARLAPASASAMSSAFCPLRIIASSIWRYSTEPPTRVHFTQPYLTELNLLTKITFNRKTYSFRWFGRNVNSRSPKHKTPSEALNLTFQKCFCSDSHKSGQFSGDGSGRKLFRNIFRNKFFSPETKPVLKFLPQKSFFEGQPRLSWKAFRNNLTSSTNLLPYPPPPLAPSQC